MPPVAFTNSVQDFWNGQYPKQTGKPYEPIKTVCFAGQGATDGCGTASSDMGPFYCPNDRRCTSTSRSSTTCSRASSAPRADPSRGYVIAHEYGHHIEDQLGILGQIRSTQGPKSDAVTLELMADCLAGAWAKRAQETEDAGGQPIITDLTQDDIARHRRGEAVGDDRIQKRSCGRVNTETLTHGSAAQRKQAFNQGLKKGTIKACNLF